MIGISKLYCGTVEASDPLRYGRSSRDLPSHLLQFSADKKPVVVWNITQRLQPAMRALLCVGGKGLHGELTTKQGTRTHQPPWRTTVHRSSSFPAASPPCARTSRSSSRRAVKAGHACGHLHERHAHRRRTWPCGFADLGLSYIGVSLDGLEEVNDCLPRRERRLQAGPAGHLPFHAGGHQGGAALHHEPPQRHARSPGIFDLMRKEGIPRICFYHLVYTGRAKELMAEDLTHGADPADPGPHHGPHERR
ncbi:MAG: hypothetical protein MZU91_13430 [Desulfosudis oleivorans]|nr:hypothetical protein [Desulfosudis oleivorans]